MKSLEQKQYEVEATKLKVERNSVKKTKKLEKKKATCRESRRKRKPAVSDQTGWSRKMNKIN